jgi:hypothetical protein
VNLANNNDSPAGKKAENPRDASKSKSHWGSLSEDDVFDGLRILAACICLFWATLALTIVTPIVTVVEFISGPKKKS